MTAHDMTSDAAREPQRYRRDAATRLRGALESQAARGFEKSASGLPCATLSVDTVRELLDSHAALLAERDALRSERDEANRAWEEADRERERYSDALIEAHRALGGDGEWCAKPGSACLAGDTGDLAIDVPALAGAAVRDLAEAEAALLFFDEATGRPALRHPEFVAALERARRRGAANKT